MHVQTAPVETASPKTPTFRALRTFGVVMLLTSSAGLGCSGEAPRNDGGTGALDGGGGGVEDAGTPVDGGNVDGGSVDGGNVDGGTPVDGGNVDGGGTDDGGTPVDGGDPYEAFQLADGHFIPAKMPMTLVHPRPDDETQVWARHRKAYPGLRYEIPVGVQGGAWPFLYELTDAPQGARIGQVYGQPNYGVVTWEAPASGTYSFEVTVTDQERNTAVATWTVEVDASAFIFLDGDRGDDATGDGTLAQPFRTFSGWYRDDANDNTHREKILVIRESQSPYALSGDPTNTNNNCRIRSDRKPIVWINYPDERPVIDAFQSKVVVVAPREDLFIAGLRFEHGRQDVNNAHFFWVQGDGDRITFWRNEYYDLGPGTVGTDNTGPVFISATGPAKRYILSKGNLYDEIRNEGYNGMYFEFYRTLYALVEEETARNSSSAAGWFPKGAIAFTTVRNNMAVDNVTGTQMKGSFGGESGELPHDQEFCWNHIRTTNSDVSFMFSASNFYAGQHYNGFVYRNTFAVGGVWARFLGAEPYEYDGNVLFSDDTSRYGTDVITHPVVDDLVGDIASGMLDADGLLTDDFAAYRGTHGHEVR